MKLGHTHTDKPKSTSDKAASQDGIRSVDNWLKRKTFRPSSGKAFTRTHRKKKKKNTQETLHGPGETRAASRKAKEGLCMGGEGGGRGRKTLVPSSPQVGEQDEDLCCPPPPGGGAGGRRWTFPPGGGRGRKAFPPPPHHPPAHPQHSQWEEPHCF